MKRQKDMTPEVEPPQVGSVQYATREDREIDPERIKSLGQRRNKCPVWMCLAVKVKSNAVKNNIA